MDLVLAAATIVGTKIAVDVLKFLSRQDLQTEAKQLAAYLLAVAAAIPLQLHLPLPQQAAANDVLTALNPIVTGILVGRAAIWTHDISDALQKLGGNDTPKTKS